MKHSGTAFDVGPAFNACGYNARSEVTTRYRGADLGDTSEPVDGEAYAHAYDNSTTVHFSPDKNMPNCAILTSAQ